jgi:hypothetical protein
MACAACTVIGGVMSHTLDAAQHVPYLTPPLCMRSFLRPHFAGAVEGRDRDGGAFAGGRRLHSTLRPRVSPSVPARSQNIWWRRGGGCYDSCAGAPASPLCVRGPPLNRHRSPGARARARVCVCGMGWQMGCGRGRGGATQVPRRKRCHEWHMVRGADGSDEHTGAVVSITDMHAGDGRPTNACTLGAVRSDLGCPPPTPSNDHQAVTAARLLVIPLHQAFFRYLKPPRHQCHWLGQRLGASQPGARSSNSAAAAAAEHHVMYQDL